MVDADKTVAEFASIPPPQIGLSHSRLTSADGPGRPSISCLLAAAVIEKLILPVV
jgi:hypothetical protein